MTKNRTPTPVYLDPGMHSGLEVKGLMLAPSLITSVMSSSDSIIEGALISVGGEN